LELASSLTAGPPRATDVQKRSHNLRIDWGCFFMTILKYKRATSTVNSAETVRDDFIADGSRPETATALQNN